MSFQMTQSPRLPGCSRNCGPAIAADGEITDATPDSFARFLQANATAGRGRAVVFINSQGGKILAGMKLGKIFRKLGVTAVVARISQGDEGGQPEFGAGACFSACVYALMGAKTRIAPRWSQIGIHRMFALEGDSQRFDDGSMAALLRDYSLSMGVSPNLVAAAEQGRPEAMRILTPAEITRWRLASPGS
jgi:hypothetical protein